MPDQAYKRCSRCHETKTADEFFRRRSAKDGLMSYCKACSRQQAREARLRHPDKVRARDRRWHEANRTASAERKKRERDRNRDREAASMRRQKQKHPEKFKARSDLNNALKTGVLVKPDRCEDCGNATEAKKLHGHHEDYSKPLDVRWLCEPCHLAEHGKAARLDW